MSCNSELENAEISEILQPMVSIALQTDCNIYEKRHEKRPWGSFEVLHEGQGYKVKRLYILPHEKTSLQMHKHRHEYWIIESGTAKITAADKVFYSIQGTTANIAANTIHRIENESDEMLVIFEVQFGELLSEDDVTRLEDKYGRV